MGDVFNHTGWTVSQSGAAERTANADDITNLAGRTVADLGERRLVAMFADLALGAGLGDSRAAGDVIVGSGDDAAVIDAAGPTVISVDTCVQDKHFRPAWSTPRQVGERAVMQSVADIAAMGARPIGVVAALICPPELPAGALIELNAGIASAAQAVGAKVLGGDLVEGREVVVSVTAVGALDGQRPTALSAAVPGDVLAVGGPLGTSAAGLALLNAAEAGGQMHLRWPEVVDAFRVPKPNLTAGPIAARAGAHAMTDISDGLIEELTTMAAAAEATLTVDTALLPRHGDLAAVAEALGYRDPLAAARHWALTGGEDHQMLAAFAAEDVPAGWQVVGTVVAGPTGVTVDGAPVDAEVLHGWRTFD